MLAPYCLRYAAGSKKKEAAADAAALMSSANRIRTCTMMESESTALPFGYSAVLGTPIIINLYQGLVKPFSVKYLNTLFLSDCFALCYTLHMSG